MSSYQLFQDKLQEGTQGESRVIAQLRSQGWEVEDVSKDPTFQLIEIDQLLNMPGQDTTLAVEIKSDALISRTGNMYVETVSNVAAGNPGWYYTTRAEFIIYYDTVAGHYHLIPFALLKMYIAWHPDTRELTTADRDAQGRTVKHHTGYLVPLKDFLSWCRIITQAVAL